MSNKRKFEEYQDPDYENPKNDCVGKKSRVELSENEKLEKIKTIVRREFQNELLQKEQEMLKIDNQLMQCKKLFHKLRYAIVANFYSKKSLDTDHTESGGGSCEPEKHEGDPQPSKPQAIHPSLKKLIGKTPINYDELLKYRPTPTRQAAETAKTTIREKLQKKKKDDLTKKSIGGTKVPRYVDYIMKSNPIPIVNSSRGRNQTRHLIVVGNTSKYVGDEKLKDSVTHKWLVYIRTKSDVPVDDIVQKVRFFLHPSYKPNDVVDITSPPYQLSRRGWGEFPVRVQFHFKPVFNQKPIQIIHNLILDKKLTGLQTMGAETIVEIWLASIENNSEAKEDVLCDGGIVKNAIPIIKNTKVKGEMIVEEKVQPVESPVVANSVPMKSDSKTDENLMPPPIAVAGKIESLNTIQKNGKIYVINPNRKLKKHSSRNQVSLLKSNQVSLLNTNQPKQMDCILSDHDYLGNKYIIPPPGLFLAPKPPPQRPIIKIEKRSKIDMSLMVSKKTIITNNTINANISYKKYLEGLFLSKLNLESNIRFDVEFLLKKLPLVCNDKNSNFLRSSYPFIQDQMANFLNLTKVKRVNYEWSRCKVISNMLRKKYHTNFWTTKEIMQFARYHGYRPDNHLFENRTQTIDTSMSAIVKQEISKKNYNNTSTLSLNTRIIKYLDQCDLNVTPLEDLIINITDDGAATTHSKNEKEGGKSVGEADRLKLFIPLHKTLDDDGNFIAETCSDIGITLGSEEIVDGILYPATQRILIHCMKYFIEDVLRRSCAVKLLNSTDSSPQIEVNDVKNAIRSREEYDFLTNKCLGVKKL